MGRRKKLALGVPDSEQRTIDNWLRKEREPKKQKSDAQAVSQQDVKDPSLTSFISSYPSYKELVEKLGAKSLDDLNEKKLTIENIRSELGLKLIEAQSCSENLTRDVKRFTNSSNWWKNSTAGLFRFSVTITSQIPVYYDVDGKMEDCKKELQSRKGENRALLILDSPGMGKSTTILVAARTTNSLYASLKPNIGVLKLINEEILRYQEAASDTLQAAKLTDDLLNVCLRAFYRFFKALLHEVKNRFNDPGQIIDIPHSTTDVPNIIPIPQKTHLEFLNFSKLDPGECATNEIQSACIEIIEELKKAINSPTSNPDRTIIIHCDEMQDFSVSTDWVRKRGTADVNKKEILEYRMSAMSSAMETIHDSIPSIKFVISGTSTLVDTAIVPGTTLKIHRVQLPIFKNNDVDTLVKFFLNLKDKNPNALQSLQGNPRGIQYFLEEAQNDKNQAEDIAKWINKAYYKWRQTLLTRLPTDGINSRVLMPQLLLVFTYYQSMGGSVTTEGNEGNVIKFQKHQFPLAWQRYAESGAFRLNVGDNAFYLHQPVGFIKTYMIETVNEVSPSLKKYLYAVTSTAVMQPATLKGIIFQFNIAAELTFPNSPLYKKILSYTKFAKLHPNTEVEKEVYLDATPYKARDFENKVYCVQDAPKAQGERIVDVAAPLVVGGASTGQAPTYYRLLIEAKHGYEAPALFKMCSKFFKQSTLNNEKMIKVFVSWVKFLESPVQHRSTNNGSDSAAESKTKILEIMQNSPGHHIVIEGADSFEDCLMPFSITDNLDSSTTSVSQILSKLEKIPIFQSLFPSIGKDGKREM